VEVNSDNYTLFHWTTENGLPQNNIQNIRMGQNGLLWMTSFDGIVQFDGNHFKVFDESSNLGMNSSFTYRMETDDHKRIWFNTEKEFCIIDSGRFYSFPIEMHGKIELLSFNETPSFTWNGDMYRFIENKASKQLIESSLGNLTYLYDVSTIVGMNDEFVVEFTLDGKEVSKYPQERYWKLGTNHIKIYYEDQYKIIELGSNGGDPLKTIKNRFPAKSVMSYHVLNSDFEIIETIDSCFIYEGENEVFNASKYQIGIQRITGALMTKENQIWVGSNGGGLFLFQPKLFKSFSTKNLNSEISGNMIYSKNLKDIYFDGGCEKLYQLNSNFELNLKEVKGCPWTILIDEKDALWINGMPVDSKQLPIGHENLMNNALIRSSYQAENENIYISTNKGIILVKNNKSSLIKGSEKVSAAYQFIENNKGDVVFCGAEGVGIIKADSIYKIWDGADGLAASDVRTIYQDSAGYYWLGYSKAGLGFFDGTKIYNYPFGKGRLNKNVWTIIEDDYGNFWMNSNQGIYAAKRTDLIDYAQNQIPDFSSRHFSVADGLANAEGNSRTQNRGFKDHEGNIWFSMISGPAFIDPERILSQHEYPIVLNEVRVDDELFNKKPFIMTPGSRFISFKFTQSILSRSQQASYFYKFEGEEESWRPVGKSREITLNEPKSGSHVLLIKKTGGSEELRIPFEVKVHFWQTNTFSYLVVFFITAFVFLVIFRVIRRRRQSKADIKRINAELKILELRALQSQMNPHFIFNCLSSISALYVSDKKAAANDYLSRFSKLLRIILEHARAKLISLKDDLEMFDIYVPLEGLQFDEPFDYELEVQVQTDPAEIFFPAMVTHTFIENAIKHGLKPLKDRKGKLKILVNELDSRIFIIIEDNGVGYEHSILYKRKLNKLHKSRGLENTNKRINLINLLNDLDIEVTTKNLSDKDGNARGTCVTISFPIIKNNEDVNS
jgi:ligand-binding sensor domain-containing protein